MLEFSLKIGHGYIAQLHLKDSQVAKTNDEIASDFTSKGFMFVTVTGTGKERTFTGTWNSNKAFLSNDYIIENWKPL